MAPLGRGGMGEVYRADDLSLGQSVALKFLPPRVSADPVKLEQLRQEVRVARQISHPSVCRVYDIGEADGRHFIAMEFVDGEDLAGFIRRIGRLPGEKAVEIARQICAGLAAIHDRGVIHRDLKPANVMIDGRGRARIMDFGVAASADELASGEANFAGTPAYMAPEQLEGREATPRSDVYALGLVLYEIFTGKPAHTAETMADLRASHRSSIPPTDPSALVADIDPAAERVILRCLEKDPDDRPPSAVAVMAGLPGADPLQALVEAGETPSPELVAASGRAGTLPVWAASGLAAIAAVCTVLAITVWAPFAIGTLGGPMLGPEVLAHRAQEVASALGAAPDPAVESSGYGLWELAGGASDAGDATDAGGASDAGDASGAGSASDADDASQVGEASATNDDPMSFEAIEARFADPLLGPRYFWYRSHVDVMVPWKSTMPGTFLGERVTLVDPPADQPGMVTVLLGPQGGLIGFEWVTAELEGRGDAAVDARGGTITSPLVTADIQARGDARDDRRGDAPIEASRTLPGDPRPAASSDDLWAPVLDALDLPERTFTEVEPRVRPRTGWDERRAWLAPPAAADVGDGDADGRTVRVEAAALQGRISSVRVLEEHDGGRLVERTREWRRLGPAGSILALLGYAVGGTLAVRNLRAGRGDRRGAARLAVLFFGLSMLGWVFTAPRLLSLEVQLPLLISGISYGLARTLLACLLYLGLEPHVRRAAPVLLIGWSRLVAGRWRDPIIGREILIGAALGSVYMVTFAWVTSVTEPVGLVQWAAMPDVARWANLFVRTPMIATGTAFIGLTIYVGMLLAARGRANVALVLWLAIVGLIPLALGGVPTTPLEVLGYVVPFAAATVVITRVGVVATITYLIFDSLLRLTPITLELGAWYAMPTVVYAAAIGGLLLYGWITSTTGRRGAPAGRATIVRTTMGR